MSTGREDDLFSISAGDFRYSDRAMIFAEAERREARGVPWAEVVEDFHRTSHWGYEVLPKGHPQTHAPVSIEARRAKEVRAFFWTAFQSLLIIKAFVLYFGLNYAIEVARGEPSPFYGWGLGLSLLVSFASLLFFAIRKSKLKDTGVFD